jgi:hypothetical protein
VLIERQNETTLVIDTADSLTHNLPETERKKIKKSENLALEIKNILKFKTISV